MLDRDHIENIARKAAYVACKVLGLDQCGCRYSVALIDDPTISEDGLLDTQGNIIQLNLATLRPFPPESMPAPDVKTDEDRALDEDYRYMMKICYVVYHEMRHLYQKRAVEIYELNRFMGSSSFKPLESSKKCELWKQEMQGYELGVQGILADGEEIDIEADANDFAYYLSNRYPIQLPMQRTSRRLGAMKRKYDKVEVPEV